MGLSKVIRCRPTRPNGPHGRGAQGHIGNVRGASGEFLGVNGRAEYVKRACEASLKRLGVEHIDLYCLGENIGALNVHLTDGQLRRLDEAFPVGAPAGERYPEQGMRTINR